nr:hypothetical protein [Tanacetum cinerariifolium]
MEITGIIVGKVTVVTEASVRRHLKLEDSEGSTVLVKFYHTPISALSTTPPYLSSPPRSSIRQETEVPQPSSPTHTYVADKAASTVKSLEADLKLTKQVYRAAYTKLTIKVKRLKKTVKTDKARRKAQVFVSDDEEEFEDPSKQGWSIIKEINQNTEVTLVTPTQLKFTSILEEEEGHIAGMIQEVNIAAIKDNSKEEEWENIRARVEGDEELTQRHQAEERDTYTLKQLKKLSFDEIKELFKATMRSIKDFIPMESEDDKAVPKLAEARSSKGDANEELDQGRLKDQENEVFGGILSAQMD